MTKFGCSSITFCLALLASPVAAAGTKGGSKKMKDQCKQGVGSTWQHQQEATLHFLNAASNSAVVQPSCSSLLDDSGALEYFKSDAIKYGAFNVDDSVEEIAETLIATCEVIKIVSLIFNGGPGLFQWAPYSNTDNHVSCENELAFSFGTGGYLVFVQGLPILIPIPGRATVGMVADKTEKFGWAIEHLHESLDFEAIIELLLDAFFSQESNAAVVREQINPSEFEKAISTMSEPKKLSWHKHVGDKYCSKKGHVYSYSY